jgi:predicted ATPase/DNA-binding CsgD family transcriptional regulator
MAADTGVGARVPETDGLLGNLPVQRTQFVGRERELEEIQRLLADIRLLTLTGAAGSGKTRLALEAAARLRPHYPDGAFLVEFAAVTDGSLVPDAIASVLNLRGDGRTLGRDSMTVVLRSKKILLVLDNCEHLTDAISSFVDSILAFASGVRVLATSRQSLGTIGEQTWRVDSLPLDQAARLFADRAGLRSGFRLDDQNRGPVDEICRRLDGLPLAIELAAARTQVLTPRQILERLTDALGLLAGDFNAAPIRQQTLQSAIDWSYRLLGATEQRLFDLLSVFAGGFYLEAAEAISASQVLDPLGHLIDKSLVIAEPDSNGSMRYRILEVLRQYGQAQLAVSGEMGTARQRHAAHYLELALHIDRIRRDGDLGHWLTHLRLEHDNFRAALEWARTQPPDLGLRLANALSRFWELSGSITEARTWMDVMLLGGTDDMQLLALALLRSARLAYLQGDYDRAWEEGQRSLAIKRGMHDGPGIARRLAALTAIAVARGDEAGAWALANECLAIRLTHGDERAVAWSLFIIGWLALLTGDEIVAAENMQKSLAAHRATSDPAGIAYSLSGLALLKIEAGDLIGARSLTRELVGIVDFGWSWLDDPGWQFVCLLLAIGEGRHRSAVRLAGGIDRLEREGKRFNEALRRRYEPLMKRARQQLKAPEDARLFAEGGAMTRAELIAEALAEPAATIGPLSHREAEVARLVAQGLSNEEIAARLFISRRTAESHLDHILGKLGLRNRSQIVAWVLSQISESGT